MRYIKDNVEREAEGAAAEKLLARGFKPLAEKKEESKEEKNLADMKVGELKALAVERGITGAEGLTKAELIAVLEGVNG